MMSRIVRTRLTALSRVTGCTRQSRHQEKMTMSKVKYVIARMVLRAQGRSIGTDYVWT
jgi:hypothetical protein